MRELLTGRLRKCVLEDVRISESPQYEPRGGQPDLLEDHQLEATKRSGEADGGELKLIEGAPHTQPPVAS